MWTHIECWMLQISTCPNVPMFKCSNVQMFKCSMFKGDERERGKKVELCEKPLGSTTLTQECDRIYLRSNFQKRLYSVCKRLIGPLITMQWCHVYFFANRIEKCWIWTHLNWRHILSAFTFLTTHQVDGSKMVNFQFCLQKTYETFNYHAMRLCVTFLQTELRNVEFRHTLTDHTSYLRSHFWRRIG